MSTLSDLQKALHYAQLVRALALAAFLSTKETKWLRLAITVHYQVIPTVMRLVVSFKISTALERYTQRLTRFFVSQMVQNSPSGRMLHINHAGDVTSFSLQQVSKKSIISKNIKMKSEKDIRRQ